MTFSASNGGVDPPVDAQLFMKFARQYIDGEYLITCTWRGANFDADCNQLGLLTADYVVPLIYCPPLGATDYYIPITYMSGAQVTHTGSILVTDTGAMTITPETNVVWVGTGGVNRVQLLGGSGQWWGD